ncbi:hypothetical protein [Motiliproteus sp. MSK22-1]|uniref:hypothetical protein n=1 Tax=Motiliproteus sp. MSK22-1 TaxID=1897630 RepID=UPI0009753DD4|nr:hypothetical protein [Motiliproteus sp. MSK22-1]OMH35347.1 hypothetical protein BGP75_10765 [Motiliproteus sp. MSK22-1]
MIKELSVVTTLLFTALTANASIITYDFSGTDATVIESRNFNTGGLSGSPNFSGSFDYNEEMSLVFSDSSGSVYNTDDLEFRMVFEGGMQGVFSGTQIVVADNAMVNGVVSDHITFIFDDLIDTDLNVGAENNTVYLVFTDDTATALDDNTFPTSFAVSSFSQQLFSWNSRELSVDNGNGGLALQEYYFVSSGLSDISKVQVPVPSSLWLFSTALFGIYLGRYKKNGKR